MPGTSGCSSTERESAGSSPVARRRFGEGHRPVEALVVHAGPADARIRRDDSQRYLGAANGSLTSSRPYERAAQTRVRRPRWTCTMSSRTSSTRAHVAGRSRCWHDPHRRPGRRAASPPPRRSSMNGVRVHNVSSRDGRAANVTPSSPTLSLTSTTFEGQSVPRCRDSDAVASGSARCPTTDRGRSSHGSRWRVETSDASRSGRRGRRDTHRRALTPPGYHRSTSVTSCGDALAQATSRGAARLWVGLHRPTPGGWRPGVASH